MEMNDEVRAILDRYGFTEGGKVKTTELISPDFPKNRLGVQPMIQQDLLAAMLQAAPDSEWFDWFLAQLCGGEDAQTRGQAAKGRKEAYIIFKLTNEGDASRKLGPMDKKKAEAHYAKYFSDEVESYFALGDADFIAHCKGGVWGIWPWLDDKNPPSAAGARSTVRPFDKRQMSNKEAIEYMGRFTAVMETLPSYNASAGDEEKVGERPEAEYDLDWLKKAVESVEFFIGTQSAVKDVANLDVWYTDDNVDVIVPYSYATAVMYGFDKWSFANQGLFHKAMRDQRDQFAAWKSVLAENYLLAFVQVKKPMPAWSQHVRTGGKGESEDEDEHTQETYTLANLALLVPCRKRFNPDDLDVFDEGAGKKVRWKWSQVVQAVRDEPQRAKPLKPPAFRQPASGVYKHEFEPEPPKGELERFVGEPGPAYADEPKWQQSQAEYAQKMAEYEKAKAEWEKSQQGKAPQAPRQPARSAQQQADAVADSMEKAMKAIQKAASKADPSKLVREPARVAGRE